MYLTETDPTHTCAVSIIPSTFDVESAAVTVETKDGGRYLESPGETEYSERSTTGVGRIIGRYRLKRCLGRGTTGSVWNAEDLQFAGRDVALKIMHADMHDEYVLARYTCEVRALARMDDPCIARIWENGRTNDGKLYIAMELVQGIQLTRFCEVSSPSLRERIAIVIKICRGIQHAHQRGILHRDLKPANILVTQVEGVGQPKIIDFGLAKSFLQPLMPGSVDTTQMGCLLGTIGYMSPEQASTGVRDVDTRSDVYSIGVVLYELLSGSLPVPREELNRLSLSQALDLVQNREAEAVSTRAQRYIGDQLHASRCQLTPQKLVLELHGDLDAILEKALSKQRARRYQSAGELADDLERYLSGGVVQARRRTWWYLTQKLLKRHWKVALGVLAVSILFLFSWIGMAMGLYWAVEARNQEKQAKEQLEVSHSKETYLKVEAEMSSEFLEKVLTSPHPNKSGYEVKLLEALDLAWNNLDKRFANHPRAEAMVRLALGRSYLRLGRTKQVQELVEPVLHYSNELVEGGQLYRLQAENLYIQSLIQDKKYDKALVRCEELLHEPNDSWLPVGMAQFRSFYQSYTRILCHKNRYPEAVKMLRYAIETMETNQSTTQADLWSLRGSLASTYAEWAATDRSIIQQAIEIIEGMIKQAVDLKSHHSILYNLRSNLGTLLRIKGDQQGAIDCFEKLFKQSETMYGDKHYNTQIVANNLSKMYLQAGMYCEASLIFRKMLAVQAQQMGLGHEITQSTLKELIRVNQLQGNSFQALVYYQQLYIGVALATTTSSDLASVTRSNLRKQLAHCGVDWMQMTAFH